MKITVTAQDIEGAKCADPRHCMIAEAIRNSVRGVAYVSVRTNGITITQRRKNGNSVRSHWAVPLKAARAIIKFDRGEPVHPFSFEPELVNRRELPPTTDDQKRKARESQRTKRAQMKVRGKAEVWRQRIAGL